MVGIRFTRVIEAPSQGEPNTVYFVKPPLATEMDILVAGSDGVPVPLAVRAIGEGGYTDAQVRQVVAAALTAGTNVKIAIDQNAGTFTISATGSTAAADWQSITGKPTTLNGFGITDAQPLDADLTAIAALATAAFGRSMLTAADAPAMRSLLALGTAALATLGTNAGNALQLDGNGKVPTNNLPEAILGAMKYQGTWDASANAPTLSASPAATTKGFYYVVSVAGATNLSGVTDWKVGDWAVSNGTTWDKVDSSDQVNSVAGLMGTISAAALKGALNLSGTNTGDQTDIAGNAGTATKLATARKINGVAFDGSQDITLPSSGGTGGGGLKAYMKKTRVTGNVVVPWSNTTFSDFDNNLVLRVIAAVDDLLEVSGYYQGGDANTASVEFNIETRVAGVAKNRGLGALGSSTSLPNWPVRPNDYFGVTGVLEYTVKAEDIDADGYINLYPVARSNGGNSQARTVFANGSVPFVFTVKNFGKPPT